MTADRWAAIHADAVRLLGSRPDPWTYTEVGMAPAPKIRCVVGDSGGLVVSPDSPTSPLGFEMVQVPRNKVRSLLAWLVDRYPGDLTGLIDEYRARPGGR